MGTSHEKFEKFLFTINKERKCVKRLREHVKRHLAQKARAGSAPRHQLIVGDGRRWYKPYRKPDELKAKRRAAAWARVETIE
jgi:hypothetical protein